MVFTFVTIVVCMVNCGLSVLAADEEQVATQSPSEELTPPPGTAEEQPEVLYTSPTCSFRVVQVSATPTSDDESGRAFWMVSTRYETRRAKRYSTEITLP